MNRFESIVFWLSNKKISFDRKYKLKINSAEFDVNVRKIKKIIDTETLDSKQSSNVSKNDICELVIHSSQLIPMDDYNFNKSTARFCILDDEEILAGGIIDLKKLSRSKRSKN